MSTLTRLWVSRYKKQIEKGSLEPACDRSAEGELLRASLEESREQRLIAAEETTS